MMACAGIVAGDNVEMQKERFLKFLVDEIERNQKDMYKTGEGKKVVAVLTQIYTLVSDGKFDINRAKEISQEIKNVHNRRDFSKCLGVGD